MGCCKIQQGVLHEMNDDQTSPSLPLWRKRFDLERHLRQYFWTLGYEETRTPLLVRSPGMEPHLRPIQVLHPQPVFLPTSPEFAMKKLLAAGLPKIFQICPAFRDEPVSPEHHPEFTMLEFYETNCSLEKLQEHVENLFVALAQALYQKTTIEFRGQKIETTGQWKRIRVVDLFQTHLHIDLRTHQTSELLAPVCKMRGLTVDDTDSWDDLYFKLWLNFIEPKFPTHEFTFVTHYPVGQSSLCNRVSDETGFVWANRFELYLGQLELGNAFDELRDADLQRKNFEKDQKTRFEIYGDTMPISPIDEEFLAAIAKMPPTAGIALGLDRICMVLLNAKTIDEVIPLKSEWK
jgi:lysyl-tRNA synthetase class 2